MIRSPSADGAGSPSAAGTRPGSGLDLRMHAGSNTPWRPKAAANILRPKDAINITKFSSASAPTAAGSFRPHPDAGDPTARFWHVGTWEFDHRINQERRDRGTARCSPATAGDDGPGNRPRPGHAGRHRDGTSSRRLTILQPLTPTPIAFSGDGTKLVANTQFKGRPRLGLAADPRPPHAMGLDGKRPPFPAAPEKPEATGPLPAACGSGLRRSDRATGSPHGRAGQEMNRRIAANPDDAEALIHRGWLFTMQKKGPEAIADLEHFCPAASGR